MNLVIDIGNTQVKSAVFQLDKLVYKTVFPKTRLVSSLKKISKEYEIKRIILSSVAKITSKQIQFIESIAPTLMLSSSTKVPFVNNYKTPKTLGVDRIALAAAAFSKYKNENTLVIDAGTCVTYDFIDLNGTYEGGAIAPGLTMRFKSLNNHTANLPLLTIKESENIIGKTTKEAILSGVVNGFIFEIDGVINHYKNLYPDLTVVLTGGDVNFLAKQLKSSIFAHSNFLLEGLNSILIFNEDE